MMAGARAALVPAAIVIAVLFLFAESAFAHTSEFILAKVTPEEGGIEIELTVDCGGNPMIASEAEARAVLGSVLRVQTAGEARELSALAPLRFERRTQMDAAAPIPRDPHDEGKPHQLLCAMWSWKCTEERIAFEVPRAAGHSLILWTPATSHGEKPRWVILLGGDVSPEIAIPPRKIWPWLLVGMSVALVGVAATVMRRRWFRSPCRAAPSSLATLSE